MRRNPLDASPASPETRKTYGLGRNRATAGHDSMRMAGHKTEQSHALYKDPRGIEWVTVG